MSSPLDLIIFSSSHIILLLISVTSSYCSHLPSFHIFVSSVISSLSSLISPPLLTSPIFNRLLISPLLFLFISILSLSLLLQFNGRKICAFSFWNAVSKFNPTTEPSRTQNIFTKPLIKFLYTKIQNFFLKVYFHFAEPRRHVKPHLGKTGLRGWTCFTVTYWCCKNFCLFLR